MPGVALRLPEHEQGLRRRPESDRDEGARDPLGLRRSGLCKRDSGDLHGRPVDAFALRRLEARRRRDGPGVRALLQDALLRACAEDASRGPTTRASSCTASSAISSNATSRAASTRSSATRGSRCATTSIPSTSPASWRAFVAAPRVGEVYNLGGGKANSTSILEAFKMAEILHRQGAGPHLRGAEPDRGPHLLLLRPPEDAPALPRLGHHPVASRNRAPDCGGLAGETAGLTYPSQSLSVSRS